MRVAPILLIFLFLTLLSQAYAEKLFYPGYWPKDGIISITLVYPENNSQETINVSPIIPTSKTICQIHGKWKLSFEITNTNPYTVFVAIPEPVWCYRQCLKYSKDFQKLGISGVVATYEYDENYTVLNGRKGIWIPPYTSVRVQRHGIFVYNLNTSIIPDRHEIIGPALMDGTTVFDDVFLERFLNKYNVKVGNYRLLVNGKIVKLNNTEILSIVIPAPLVLDDYYAFHKLLGKYDVDIWVNSYRNYVNKHNKLYINTYERTLLERHSKLSNLFNNVLISTVDDTLVPDTDNNLKDENFILKPFDVPAMVLTTDDGDRESIEFSYVMYKY